jgi:triosephosphate isomerase
VYICLKKLLFEVRRKIIAANWKMYKTVGEAEATVAELQSNLSGRAIGPEVFIAAPFPHLDRLIQRFENTGIRFGAQNLNEHDEGAFTGEVSGAMLRSIGCSFVVAGHSERRQYFGETDLMIRQKIQAAQRHFLQVIFCCGESAEDRQANRQFDIVDRQMEQALDGFNPDVVGAMIIAYEPVWAIGTGQNASPEQAQEMHAHIRQFIAGKYGEKTAAAIRILYGGSVKAANASSLFHQPDIDGGLVGGASLVAAEFARIIESAAS